MDQHFIPYGRQHIDEEDIAAVVEVLRSDWLTTGPAVERFEEAVAATVSASCGVALCNGTAALHATMFALGVGPGDEVIVPPMTFAATANAVLYQGARPVFADVHPDTLLLDAAAVESRINGRTRAIIAVDYAGQPCDYDALRAVADRYGLKLVADACHSLGAAWRGRPCGALADATVFSFHPVKPVTTGEGGMVVTGDAHLAQRLRTFRNHGIGSDHRQRAATGAWHYQMLHLGFNYRLTDIQAALGLAQLSKLPRFTNLRRNIAARYDAALSDHSQIRPLTCRPEAKHGYHLYVVRIPQRDRVFQRLRQSGIGANVHYVPVHFHPYYRQHLGTGEGLCPVAETAYQEILSLPIFPDLSTADQERVINALHAAVTEENP